MKKLWFLVGIFSLGININFVKAEKLDEEVIFNKIIWQFYNSANEDMLNCFDFSIPLTSSDFKINVNKASCSLFEYDPKYSKYDAQFSVVDDVVVFSGTVPWPISENFSECLKYVGNVQSTICVKRFGL